METKIRTIIKALTWRTGGLIITTSVVWTVTGEIKLAASIGLVDTIIKLIAYYVHERCWLKIRFGKMKPPEYQI